MHLSRQPPLASRSPATRPLISHLDEVALAEAKLGSVSLLVKVQLVQCGAAELPDELAGGELAPVAVDAQEQESGVNGGTSGEEGKDVDV
jgi:hypothetical protein